MKIEKAIEVLKYHNEWRLGSNLEQTNSKELTKALITAIEVMEKRKFDIMKAFEEGRNSVLDDRMDIKTCNQYYNSLTAPAGSGDEKP